MNAELLIRELKAELYRPLQAEEKLAERAEYRNGLRKAIEIIRQHSAAAPTGVADMDMRDQHRLDPRKLVSVERVEKGAESVDDASNLKAALELLYDKWENGNPINELDDGEPTGAYMGNCVSISSEEEDDILLLIGSEATKERIRKQRATITKIQGEQP